MRLLFRDAVARQQVNDRLSFDLKLPRQFVNPYLICVVHCILLTASRSSSCPSDACPIDRDPVLPTRCFPILSAEVPCTMFPREQLPRSMFGAPHFAPRTLHSYHFILT